MKVDWGLITALTVLIYGIGLGIYLIYLKKKKQISKSSS